MTQDGRLDILMSDDNGLTWAARRVAVDGPLDDRNPAFGSNERGDLILAFAVLDAYDSTGAFRPERARVESYLTRSTDGGLTWESPQPLDVGPFEWSSPYGKIARQGSALVLAMYGGYLPVYSDSGKPSERRGNFAFVLRSADGGEMWGRPEVIAQGFAEPAVVPLSPDLTVAALRRQGTNVLFFARHRREAGGWVVERQITAAGENPADIVSLPGGELLLTYGHRAEPFGLHIRVSRDTGRSWNAPSVVAVDANSPDFGYPSSVLVSDTVITVYYVDLGMADGLSGRFARALRYSPRYQPC